MATAATTGRAVSRLGVRNGLDLASRYGVVVVFAALFLTLSLASEPFLTTGNLLNILDQQAPLGVIACAGTLVIIAGGFDLSVAAVFALGGVLAAKVANATTVEVGFVAGCLTGLALGVINGVLIELGRVNAFIGTLASSMVVRGLAVTITGGLLVAVHDDDFRSLAQSELLGAKVSVFVLATVVAVTWYLLERTTFGRQVFAVGGNREAARLSGVRVGAVRAATFALSGLCAGVAGVLAASRVGTGQADAGAGLELQAIAAIVIGGTSILGGEGAIWRTLLGVLLLALIGNGFNLLDINPTYSSMVQGGIILLAVAVDALGRRRSS
jgi:ribose transport system permease protein